MMARSGSEVPMVVASADNMGSSDPWVPRGNVAPLVNPCVSFMKNNDIQGVSHIPIASPSSNERSIRGTIGIVPVTNEMNTSQAVQTIPTQTTQHTEATTLQMASRALTNNESMIAPSLASQQPINTSSVKEPGKSHNNMMTENEKGAARRDRIHSQDLNIDDDVEDIEEDDEEDEDEDEEIEDDESESEVGEERVPTPKNMKDAADDDLDTDQETDRLLGQQYNDDNGYYDSKNEAAKKKGSKTKEGLSDPKVLIEGVLFRARYLGSTQLVCEGQPTKATRMMQAEEAVSRIKALAPEGESQPSTEVDLFISTEKIMVLNTDLKEIMMDHALRSISYIADIGDLLVIMARRRLVPPGSNATPSAGAGNTTDGNTPNTTSGATTTGAVTTSTSTSSSSVIPVSSASALSAACDDVQVIGTTPKMICHVFESEEAQFIAQSIGQAFQVAYMEFLKANGIEDHSFVKEMDYQEVLNSQEIFGDELAMFARKELQKEVVVPKAKGEILGVVIVESGWGSMLPTIVLANLSPTGPAARCGQLNIGDQVIAINGISLVGLPLSTCQNYVKNTKNKTAVKLTAVSCAPVVEVKIKRPDTKYQLGFSVQNGVICSLLRGGIAERGGVRVGHRIIEINGQSVVAVPHERIVNLLATSVGEITMRTMPTSMFRLLTGQETPMYI
jgi:hypothetical protein